MDTPSFLFFLLLCSHLLRDFFEMRDRVGIDLLQVIEITQVLDHSLLGLSVQAVGFDDLKNRTNGL